MHARDYKSVHIFRHKPRHRFRSTIIGFSEPWLIWLRGKRDPDCLSLEKQNAVIDFWAENVRDTKNAKGGFVDRWTEQIRT